LEMDLSDEEFDAIALLLNTGVIDEQGNINQAALDNLAATLPADRMQPITDAYNRFLGMQTIGNFFSELWRGVKIVTLAIPRNAYLSLVALNVHGYASKLEKVLQYRTRQRSCWTSGIVWGVGSLGFGAL
jgi:hypothetical protein